MKQTLGCEQVRDLVDRNAAIVAELRGRDVALRWRVDLFAGGDLLECVSV